MGCALVSKVTEAVFEGVTAGQSRPLEAVYLIVYLDGLVVKTRQDKQVINKVAYLAKIRRIIYTTNSIESLNGVVRKPLKQFELFPIDGAAMKIVYLASMAAARN